MNKAVDPRTRLSIASVERETGIPKDTLQVWERRYGFPAPDGDENGERAYPPTQVQRLIQIKRLMDCGHRPGKLLRLDELGLAELNRPSSALSTGFEQRRFDEWLRFVRTHGSEQLLRAFQREVTRHGLARVVQDIASPLIVQVGTAWSRGEIGVFEEHLFSQCLEKFFHSAVSHLARPSDRRGFCSPRCRVKSTRWAF
jgi:hypothetical protein